MPTISDDFALKIQADMDLESREANDALVRRIIALQQSGRITQKYASFKLRGMLDQIEWRYANGRAIGGETLNGLLLALEMRAASAAPVDLSDSDLEKANSIADAQSHRTPRAPLPESE